MAPFYQYNPTNDPDYSRVGGVDRSAYQADQSLAKVFEGVGNVLDLGAKGIDTAITDQIKKDARAQIDPIQNDAGVNTPLSDVQTIAGTGAKGRTRLMQTQQNGALGEAGVGTGTSIGGGGGDVQPAPLPPVAQQSIGNVKRLNDAYQAGTMSNSYYQSRLQSVVTNLRAQYPGYEDQIDHAVSQITGIIPANALRASLLQDINANQAALFANQSAQEKRIWDMRTNIGLVAPDFFANRQKYSGQEQQVLAQAINVDSRLKGIQADEAQAGFDGRSAVRSGTLYASTAGQAAVTSLNNTTGMAGKSFKETMDAVRKFGGTPQQIAELDRQLSTVITNTENQIRSYYAEPRLKDGQSYNSMIGDKTKVDAMVTQGTANLRAIQEMIRQKDFSRAAVLADTNQMLRNDTAVRLQQQVPMARILGGLNQTAGDAATGIIANYGGVLPALARQITNLNLSTVLNTAEPGSGAPSISSLLNNNAEAAHTTTPSGSEVKAHVNALADFIKEPRLGPEVNSRAAYSLFDQDFFANLDSGSRVKAAQIMVSPQMTAKVKDLSANDPNLWNKYQQFTTFAVGNIMRQQGQDVQRYIQDKGYNITFDPKTLQFTGTAVGNPNMGLSGASNRVLADTLAPINNAIQSAAAVYKANGEDPAQGVAKLLVSMGVDPNAPKADSIFSKAFQGIVNADKSLRDEQGRIKPFWDNNNDPFKPSTPGKESFGGQPQEKTREVIGQAESGGDYNAVFGMGKSANRDLSSNTVGEIMAMQKHYTDSGSPSSAVGKYQFLRKTLASLVKEGVVSADDQFTPDVQDRLAVALMNRRGLGDYKAGKISKEQFANNLAQEWAGLPTSNGMSFYAGDGLNASTVKLPQVLTALENDT